MNEELKELNGEMVRVCLMTKHGHFNMVGQLWKSSDHGSSNPEKWGVHDRLRAFTWAFFEQGDVERIEDYSDKKFGFSASIVLKGDYNE